MLKEGIKIKDLATAANVSLGTLSRVFNKKANPRLTYQNRLLLVINRLSTKFYLLDDVFPNKNTQLQMEMVFKRAGVPQKTFVKSDEYFRLLVSLREPGRCLIVQGPSGIGKTTSIKKIIDDIHLDRDVTYLSCRDQNHLRRITDIALGNERGMFIIDDFHKLEDKIKNDIANRIKIITDDDDAQDKIVLIGINKVARDLYNFSSDLVGKIDVINFKTNSNDKLEELINKGEIALNISFGNKSEIINEASGSFHLLQL